MAVKFKPSRLDKKVAKFLKERRGTLSYEKFAPMTGFSKTTLYDYENLKLSITLCKLEALCKRLRAKPEEVLF